MNSDTLKLPSKADILELVRREDKIRRSAEYIKECDNVADEINGWLRVTDEMQRKLIHDYGFGSPIIEEIALNMLRRAQYLYPDEDDVKNLLYVKENKANQGKYVRGDTVPNVSICRLDTSNVDLFDIINTEKPCIIFGGSHT